MALKPVIPYQPKNFPNPELGTEGLPRFLNGEFLRIAQALETPLVYGPVAVPTNANAKAAGCPVGGLYTDTADPAKVYVRTA